MVDQSHGTRTRRGAGKAALAPRRTGQSEEEIGRKAGGGAAAAEEEEGGSETPRASWEVWEVNVHRLLRC